MPFGVIKDYFSKLVDAGKFAGDFLIKNYKPILEGVETVSGVLRHVPVVGTPVGWVHEGSKLTKAAIEGIKNREVKEKLKSAADSPDQTVQPTSGLTELSKPVNGGEKAIEYSKDDLKRYSSPGIQHNVLRGEKVPYDIAKKKGRLKWFSSMFK